MRSLLLVFLATACSEGRVLQTPPDGSVEGGYTWWADVQPIIETKCQLCHGNPTRFAAIGSLVTYQDTQAPSSAGIPMHLVMAHRVRDDLRPMPPASQPVLTAEEAEIIETWSVQGAIEGDAPGATFFTDVQPILRDRCWTCHSNPPTNGAPRPLASYTDLTVLNGAGEPIYEVVAQRTGARTMPPVGQPMLTDAEIATIGGWAATGAPAGRQITSYSWQQDVRPIIEERCGSCHGLVPQFGAPRSIATWEQTQVLTAGGMPVHELMASRTTARSMPPTGQPQLTEAEIAIIASWSMGGAPDGRDMPGNSPTWWRDVEPIVRRRCQTCHTNPPQFGAPVPFVTYEDVLRPHASGQPYHEIMAYRIVAPSNAMPPPTQPQLTQPEIATIQQWSRAGAPEGDRADNDAGTDGGVGDSGPGIPWSDGGSSTSANPNQRWIDFYAHQPGSDPPAPFQIPLGETQYTCWSFPIGTPLGPDEYAVFVEPILWTDVRHLHHMMLYQDRSNTIPASNGVVGPYDCPAFPRAGDSTALADYMGGWFPGLLPYALPEGVGIRVGPTDRVIIQNHYDQVNQEGRTDFGGVRLLLDQQPHEEARTFWTGAIWGAPLTGADEIRQGTCAVQQETNLFASFPHMHTFGTRITAEIMRQGDTDWTTISEISTWNFREQPILPVEAEYQHLNPGDQIRTTCYWDTRGNTVNQGEGSQDEMCFVIFWHYPPLADSGPENPCVNYVP
jgi:uncharacterized membrane protein